MAALYLTSCDFYNSLKVGCSSTKPPPFALVNQELREQTASTGIELRTFSPVWRCLMNTNVSAWSLADWMASRKVLKSFVWVRDTEVALEFGVAVGASSRIWCRLWLTWFS
jgi:hypothetical protein